MKKQEYKEQERQRHYYFFDYLFWLGEITWENYHKVNSKQPRGNDMLLACIMFFVLMPILTIGGHFLYDHDRLIFELFSAVLLIVFAIVAIARDRLLGEIYPPSRRKAVMRHYAGRKFSPARRNLFFFPLFVLLIPAMVLLSTALKGITDNEAKQVEDTRTEVPQRWRDYLSLHITVGARQEVPSETLQYLINQDGRTSRYGQPVYVMQVREKDMGGKFRAWLLNHATFEEIQDGRRKFVECTWVKGYTPDNIRVLLTGWYEVRNAGLCPVDSLEWTEDTEF